MTKIFSRAEEIANRYHRATIGHISDYCGRSGVKGKALRITVPRIDSSRFKHKSLQHPLLTELRECYPRDQLHHGCLRVKIDDESLTYLSYKTFILHLSS
jgi:hypothetical protein